MRATLNQPSGLSDWDADFLKARYESNQTSRTQRSEIAERVVPEHQELVGPLTIELTLKTPIFIGITPIRESQLPRKLPRQ
jgi:hypothetical protein